MPSMQKPDDRFDGQMGAEAQDAVPDMQEQDGILSRWLRHSVLSSPVSRMQTRNPFLKQIVELPRPPLSPAAVPLPTPTPSEMLELDIQQI
ncbi:hypothetical protein FA13DRAFT_1727524 [Coprinellus micaceus]|uniref:Uncharacterized protein n=1 Tax=Coprinellus micaceus TaxID=71717 RepID=A0A4Y7TP22_COPMI|nr:hypothetical protein FA13DRAFT_1727524 [Coprinellus micaceus]